ncbi:MAG: DegT/DnrJ/EryC1/StrS family aminotransferase [Actinomycetota bacterium]|nr:DegT/DnrJ/EryC1/StrS family aminotransferase [Actinomycetota bacterium]
MSDAPWRITLADVVLDERERTAVDDVLRSGWLSMGPVTERFEIDFASYLRGGHAVAVTNGTAALHLAAVALGIGPGDEVICPTLTFVATAAAMLHAGATVRFADSTSSDDFSIDPNEIDRLVTQRTKAVIVVHYGGFPVDMEAVRGAAERYGLFVLEDAAHAVGSRLDGQLCGMLGDAGCFSFFPNKNITTGEGGMIVFRDEKAVAKARRLRSHGMTTLTWDRHRGHATGYDVVDLGFNYRLDELRAALGIVQLSRVDELNDARTRLASRYKEKLVGGPFEVPTFGGRGRSAHHLEAVLAASPEERDSARERLREKRIQTSIHYPPIHRFSHYRSGAVDLPEAEGIAERVLTLPLHPRMSDADVDEVCSTLLECP